MAAATSVALVSSGVRVTSQSTAPTPLSNCILRTHGSGCETLATSVSVKAGGRPRRNSSRSVHVTTSVQVYGSVDKKNLRVGESKRIRSLKSASAAYVKGHGHEELRAWKANSTRDGVHRNAGTILATITPSIPAPSPTMFVEVTSTLGTYDNRPLEVGEEPSGKPFVWKNNWYPVSPVEDLDPSLPTAVKLLGRELVLWRDADKIWRAFLDECPHRLAPLSEGRLDEKGQLQCAYHGWAFKGDGGCGAIPQASSKGPEASAQFSPRACAVSFPTQESQGLLFVWPDEHGWDMAAATEPQKLPAEFDDPDNIRLTTMREVYYDYTVSMENMTDPSHLPFSHHKVVGRREDAAPIPLKLETSVGPWGFSGTNEPLTPRLELAFHAPCFTVNKFEILLKLPFYGAWRVEQNICTFQVPVAPGVVRAIVNVCRKPSSNRRVIAAIWRKLFPRWLEHWLQNNVLDGDMILLMGQQKAFLKKGVEVVNDQYSKITFTPTSSDRFVLAFRNWLRRYGGGKVDWASGSYFGNLHGPATMSRREMLDRLDTHTAKCASCRKALEGFRFWQKVFIGHAVVMALAACAGVPAAPPLRLLMGAGAAINAFLAYALKQGESNFIFNDYVHGKIE